MCMNRIYIIAITIMMIAASSCSHKKNGQRDAQSVKIGTVVSSEGRCTMQFPGRVRASDDAELSFRVPGNIQKINVKSGDRVVKGQVLASLDPSDYQVQLDAAEAQYRQVKAEAERVIALYKDGGTSANNYDKAVYGLKQVDAKYRHCQDQIGYTKLRAPYSGIVQNKIFEEHETVGAGMPVISMVGDGRPEVVINLPAADYVRRGRFNSYSCTIDIFPDTEFKLVPYAISPKANSNQLYTMKLRMTDMGKAKPSPGMNCIVTISFSAEDSSMLSVPSTSIMEKDNLSYVYTYDDKSSTVRRVQVTPVHLLSDGTATIISASLNSGDKIVTAGVHHIQDGEKVRPIPPVSSTNVGGLL